MSIAVSTVVQPSRRLSAMVRGMCVMVLCAGAAVGAGVVGQADLLVRLGAMAVCLLLAMQAWRAERRRQPYRIQIAGTGQIRLGVGSAPPENVRLLPASVLWPGLLILHLQNAKRHTKVVIVLRDAVSPDGFRELLVACRWIAMRQPMQHDATIARDI